MRRKIASIVVAMVLATSPAAAKPSKAWCAQQIASCTKAEADWLPLAQKLIVELTDSYIDIDEST